MDNVDALPLDQKDAITALSVISGHPPFHIKLTPDTIKQAERALLSWENSKPNDFVLILIAILNKKGTSDHSNIKLAALLTLKAVIGRKWKDRGRKSKAREKSILLGINVKSTVKQFLLVLVTNDCESTENKTIESVCNSSLQVCCKIPNPISIYYFSFFLLISQHCYLW